MLIHCAVLSVAELQNKLQELERQLNELNERRMMLEVELSIIDTSDRKVVCSAYVSQYLDALLATGLNLANFQLFIAPLIAIFYVCLLYTSPSPRD